MNIASKFINSVKSVWHTFRSDSFVTWFNGRRLSESPAELIRNYKGLVFSCVSAIASDVAKYEPVFIKGKDKTPKHELLEIIKRPNKYMTQYELFEATQTYLELVGEAFWYLGRGETTGKIKEILVVRPDMIDIVIDEQTGDVLSYNLRKHGGTTEPLRLDEIVHIKNFNPINPYRGISPLSAAILAVETENTLGEFVYNFLNNQASPSGVLSLNGNIDTEAFNKLKVQWRENQEGVENVGKTLIIRSSDAVFTKIGLSIQELDISGIKTLTKQEVLEAFKVPEAILGKTDSSGLGRANIEAIEYIFSKRTIEPKLVRLDDVLYRMLVDFYNETNIKVNHVSQVPEDNVSLLNERVAGVDRWITRNEIRAEMGFAEVKGGDKLYYEFSKIPLGEEMPQEEASKTIVLSKKKVSYTDNPSLNRLFESIDKIEVKTEKAHIKGLKKLLDAQKKKVIEIVEGFASKQFVGYDGTLFTMFFSPEELRLSLLAPLFEGLIKAGQEGIDLLGEPDRKFVLEQATRDAVFGSTDRLMKGYNEQTALLIQKQVADVLQNGGGVDEIKKRIEEVYSEAKGYRAERIANTEAHKAINYGIAESYRQSGVRQVEWVANPGACKFCVQMAGTRRTIGMPFVPRGGSINADDGEEFLNDYDDITYADAHPNCKCKLMPVL